MKDRRFICNYPQGKFCGNNNCALADYCSSFPKMNISFKSQMKYGKYNKVNGICKTEAEKKEHQKLYQLYNNLFGNLKNKRIAYNRKYYQDNRERILRDKKKPVSYSLLCVQQCEYSCYNCPYDDCIIPIPKTRKEYMNLYYSAFHDKLLKQKSVYRLEHRAYLNNLEKIRNYKKKGYIMNECILKETNNPEYEKFEGIHGLLTIIKINGNDYISFISIDREFSFRAKIDKRLNDLSNPICKEAYYSDYDGYEYTFVSTVNPGNPLWEMEHNNNFIRN